MGAGNARALFTVIVYVYGPTVVFVELSFTLTLNETVAAEAGVPLTVSVEPLSAALSPSDKAVTVQRSFRYKSSLRPRGPGMPDLAWAV